MLGMTFTEDELVAICNSRKDIYIYGAGKNGEAAYHFLEARGIKVKGFLVSHMFGNPVRLLEKDVRTISDFKEDEDGLIIVLSPSGSKIYKEIYDILVDYQVHNVYFVPKGLLQLIRMEGCLYKKREFFNRGKYHLGEDISVEAEYEILVMEGTGEEKYHWRFPTYMIREQTVENIEALFAEQSALEEFERMYGKYHIYLTDDKGNFTKGRGGYAVYMACSHVDRKTEEREFPSWIIPIQVGADLTEADICEWKDNTGENISEKNGNYSECTAIYWMWKNAPKADYIGLCHYRRHFALEENEICGLGTFDIDVLLTTPSFVAETVETFFSALIPSSDIKVMMEAIKRVCPEYLPVTERFLKGRFYPPCNIFIMKHDIFQKYGEFAFSVTFEIERFYDEMGYYRKDRYMGFIMECLLGIFIVKNKDRLKIAYTDMKFYS